jgi:hypothetical protein
MAGKSLTELKKLTSTNLQIPDYLKPLDIIKKPVVREDSMDATKLQKIIVE